MEDNGKRMLSWDIVKGITILIMIVGHVASIPQQLRNFIFSFHMPVFFVANAYFIKNYQIGYNLKRSSKSLLLPYILVCVVTAMLCVNINDDMSTNYRVFGARILDMIGGISKKSELFPWFESVWMVWFVVCLFAARMIYIVSMRVLKKAPEIVRFLAVCLLTYTGYYIGTNISFLPWSLDIALFAQIFMWFGDFIHRKRSFLPYKRYIACVGMVVWILLTLNGYWLELAIRRYPGGSDCHCQCQDRGSSVRRTDQAETG